MILAAQCEERLQNKNKCFCFVTSSRIALPMQSSKVEKEMDEIIQNYKRIINSLNAISIIGYHSRNAKFRDGFKEMRYPCLQFLIKNDQILDMFGGLQI